METPETTSQVEPEPEAQETPQGAPPGNGKPVRLEPDLEFIERLTKQGGFMYRKCFQCGTCSATCSISPVQNPFPRKEMVWARWGLRDRLLTDPDIWLCYQCNDCSIRCPRNARPGDVMAALRREAVVHHTVPRFLGRWVNRSRYIPLLLGFPAVLLGLAILVRDPLARMLGKAPLENAEITFSYSSHFPHWLLNSFFLFFSVLALTAAIAGVVRFWRALIKSVEHNGVVTPAKTLGASIASVLKSVIKHEKFSGCTSAHTRFLSHLLVFFGFLALSVVTLWVITSGVNPLAKRAFTYPFSFWSPWKMLANIGGLAVLVGCIRMIYERLKDSVHVGKGKYFDWAFVMTLALVVVTGFATEALHYGRLEPHRHVVYFVHLVLAFALLIYLPYSKFAHLLYRTTAMVFAEYTGRAAETLPEVPGGRAWANEQKPNETVGQKPDGVVDAKRGAG